MAACWAGWLGIDGPPPSCKNGQGWADREGGTMMTIREVLRLLHEDGWTLVATRGSHRQFRHPTKPGRVTVAGKPSDDLAPGTLNSILKQAGLKGDR